MSSTSELVEGTIAGVAAAVAAGTITLTGKNGRTTVDLAEPTALGDLPMYNDSLQFTRDGQVLSERSVVNPGDTVSAMPRLSNGG